MAYFLGRDVKVAMTTESDDKAVGYASYAVAVAVSANTPTGMHDRNVNTSDDADGANVFNTSYQTTAHETNPLQDVTGVDISLGTIDEDIAYMGQRTALKAEIKKETTVAITAKKSDNFFSALFNDARYGIESGGTSFTDGLTQPTANHGYRLHVALNDGSEVISVPNCTFSEYSTSLSADGVTEETMTFISHVKPSILENPYTSETTAF